MRIQISVQPWTLSLLPQETDVCYLRASRVGLSSSCTTIVRGQDDPTMIDQLLRLCEIKLSCRRNVPRTQTSASLAGILFMWIDSVRFSWIYNTTITTSHLSVDNSSKTSHEPQCSCSLFAKHFVWVAHFECVYHTTITRAADWSSRLRVANMPMLMPMVCTSLGLLSASSTSSAFWLAGWIFGFLVGWLADRVVASG